jgi:hypothetical protein
VTFETIFGTTFGEDTIDNRAAWVKVMAEAGTT